ncbi:MULTISPECIES: hypothetical protein [unclassified Halomonas]|uniref:hypothetical protein n=1 Tax=unclassified Halomonas TaxID=2609666 RepID=UPI00209E0C9F|nr:MULTISPECIES: hypothetical protein [unclassified Halomonas]MCP1314996.1 hypothetical protein [Halomonas sp. 707D7]MCP1327774.1 hypothetical protein [Halomonas sp. 707D4]
MKRLTATAAIALALVSGSAFAERGSAELNAISQPSSTVAHQSTGTQASVEQVIARNSASGEQVTPAHSHASDHAQSDRKASLSQLTAKNGATGEQTPNADAQG